MTLINFSLRNRDWSQSGSKGIHSIQTGEDWEQSLASPILIPSNVPEHVPFVNVPKNPHRTSAQIPPAGFYVSNKKYL